MFMELVKSLFFLRQSDFLWQMHFSRYGNNSENSQLVCASIGKVCLFVFALKVLPEEVGAVVHDAVVVVAEHGAGGVQGLLGKIDHLA